MAHCSEILRISFSNNSELVKCFVLDWMATHSMINYVDIPPKKLKKAITTCNNTCPKWNRGQAGHKKLPVNHVLTKVEQYLSLWFSSQSSKLLFTEEAHVVRHQQRKAERRRTRNMDYSKITMQSKSGKTSYSRSILKCWTVIYKKKKFFFIHAGNDNWICEICYSSKFFLSGRILIYGQIRVSFLYNHV